jgi:nicotinate-nucleotide adenylyltransferase
MGVPLGGIKAAVLGGTFNPVHEGHLHIARFVWQVFEVSQVYFVIAATPPHKSLENMVSLTHRYAMLCLATQGIQEFTPSLVELERPASPFSVDTLEKLASRIHGPILFIAGGDSLLEVASWHRGEELLARYHFVFITRPGFPNGTRVGTHPVCDLTGLPNDDARERVRAEFSSGHHIFLLDAGAPDISSSRIRKLSSSGEPFQHLVPGPVHEYIRKLHLYGDQ